MLKREQASALLASETDKRKKMTTTTKDLSSALPGDIIRYSDGNPAHDGIGTVVGKDGMFLHVQFADRAEISLIGLTDAPWIDHLTLLPAPRS